MANLILNPKSYARGILMNLGGGALITRNMSSEYTAEFKNQGKQIKKGDTVYVQKPQRFEGTTLTKFTPEDIKNTETSVVVDKTFGIHFQWPSKEKTLKISDANRRYFKPAAMRVAAKVNSDAAEHIFFNSFNTVGTPGVTPGAAGGDTVFSTMQVYQNAGDLLFEQGMPKGENLMCVVTRRMASVLSARYSGLFAPIEKLNRRWETGEMDKTGLGYAWDWDQGLYTHTNGTIAATPAIDGAGQVADDGDNSSQSLLLKTSTGCSIKRGDWLTIAGVYAVHPQTRVFTGQLKQFKVLADAAAAGAALTIVIAPAITPAGQYQNVDAAPADSAEVLFCSSTHASPTLYSAVTSKAGLLIHQNAHAFVSVPYENEDMGGAQVANETDPETGISLRVVKAYDWDEDRGINRIDTLYGFGWLYREMASIILAA